MRIEKAVTPKFSQYEVFTKILRELPQNRWQKIIGSMVQPTEEIEVKIQGVVEADDETGLLVQHMNDDKGNFIYTNEADDIVIDNSVRLLLLLPEIRKVFLAAGYKPKLSRTYVKSLIIRFKGPGQPDVIIREIAATDSMEVK